MFKKLIVALCIIALQLALITEFKTKVYAAAGNSATPFIMAAAGGSHTVALKKDGTVWSWGSNESGQLGDGTTKNKSKPVQVVGLKSVISVGAGAYSSFAIKSDGTVWSWGYNYYGQLGDGSNKNKLKPVQVFNLKGIKSISSSNHSVLAVKKDGTVWGWGNNAFGQLGDGTKINRFKPVQVKGLNNVIAVASGGFHALALQKNGTVFAWGKNKDGQLGDGTNIDRKNPVRVSGLNNIKAIAAGGTNNLQFVKGNMALSETGHSAAIKNDGTVWCWGQNDFGQLGDGTNQKRNKPVCVLGLNNVSAISLSGFHILVQKKDGTLWSWGSNQSGQLGDGTSDDRNKPVQIKGMSGVKSFAAGGGACTRYQGNEIQISSVGFTIIVKSDGSITGWGYNESGQLGDGTTNNKAAPTQKNSGKTQPNPKTIANKPPEVNYITTYLAGNGNLGVGFQAYDPEGKMMRANCYIVDSDGNELTWSDSTKVSPEKEFGNSIVAACFMDSNIRSLLTLGTAYKVRVDLFDADGGMVQGYSNAFKYFQNQPANISDIKVSFNSEGGLTVTFNAYDPEKEVMKADCYITDSYGNKLTWSDSTITTPTNNKIYNGAVDINIPSSTVNPCLTGGNSYKICVELEDYWGAKTQSCSDAFAISKNQAPQVSNINTKLNSDGSLTINFSANDPEGQ
ncbi:MAG TPA: hypothetical protein VHT34_03930, partial [Clostridia bacterium]|nr:hypothetical protein [Clostridia bacterium]